MLELPWEKWTLTFWIMDERDEIEILRWGEGLNEVMQISVVPVWGRDTARLAESLLGMHKALVSSLGLGMGMWCMPVIPACGRGKWKEQKVKVRGDLPCSGRRINTVKMAHVYRFNSVSSGIFHRTRKKKDNLKAHIQTRKATHNQF